MNDRSPTSKRASETAPAEAAASSSHSSSNSAPTGAGLLVLASASPRRREILGEAGVPFELRPSTIEERALPGERAGALAERLAREKALDVARQLAAGPLRPVLGADTIVVLDDEVLGKPRDEEHAVEMLSRLMGRGHTVMTGVALAWTDGRPVASRVVKTRVEMRAATRDELVAYVALGESLDKAGAYALQGGASQFVTTVDGSRTNVIGLPIEETLALLAGDADARPPVAAPAADAGPIDVALREDARRRYEDVCARIARAAERAGRDPAAITLVGVAKRQPLERILATVEAGLRVLGENFLQEARDTRTRLEAALATRATPLPNEPLVWRMVGRLQRNKVAQAVRLFDAIESVDRVELVAPLARQAAESERVLDVLVQINVGDEPQKGGCAFEDAPALLERIAAEPALRLRGLMAVPPASEDPEASRPYFRRLRLARDEWARTIPALAGGDLSMGMSHDFEVAVEEGATLVRVGTALFGPRSAVPPKSD